MTSNQNTPELFGSKYHARYSSTRYDWSQDEPCAHCGRRVNVNRDHYAIEFEHQGWFAIGSECRKMFPAARKITVSQ